MIKPNISNEQAESTKRERSNPKVFKLIKSYIRKHWWVSYHSLHLHNTKRTGRTTRESFISRESRELLKEFCKLSEKQKENAKKMMMSFIANHPTAAESDR